MPKNGGAGMFEGVGKTGVDVAGDVASMGMSGVSGTVSKFRRTVIENKGIAVGFMVGMATIGVIKGIVDDLFMPLLSPLLGDVGSAEWTSKVVSLGPVKIKAGNLLSIFMTYFLTIIAIYIFIHALE